MKRIKVIVLEPQSGLCNRMRAIASARRLAQKYERELYVLWNPDLPGLGYGCAATNITQLFSSDNGFKVIKDFNKFSQQRTIVKYQKTCFGPLVLDLKNDQEEIVYIRTNLWIYDSKDNKKHNIFKKELQNIVPNSRVVKDSSKFAEENGVDKNCIGIHVRRTDIKASTVFGLNPGDHATAEYTPYDSYFEFMDTKLKGDPDTKFFLASDDASSKKEFQKKYGDSLVCFNNRGYSRMSLPDTQDAMTDLYLLSRCSTVVSCKGSSFGHVASLIGDAEYIRVEDSLTKKKIDLPVDYSGDNKGTIKNWAVGMTLAPRSKPTHNPTLQSAKDTGFDNIHLFIEDPDKVEIDKKFKKYPRTLRNPPLGAWKNWITSLEELYETYPDQDAYVMLQDDVSFCKNIKKFLEKSLWVDSYRNTGVISVYCPSHYEREIPGWYKRNVGLNLRPALTFIFPPESVESVLRYFKKNPWKRKANIDNAIGQWARHTKRLPYFFSPSLAQHVGHSSAISPWKKIAGKRKSKQFVGEDFDAMEFLNG